MRGNNEVVIGSKEADHVTVAIVRRWSDGGSNADIDVRCDGWTGRITGVFHKGELRQFAQQLRELYVDLSGIARLQPLEPNVALTLSGDGRGHIKVEGTARNHFENGTQLVFRFTIDQTYLNGLADSLAEADPE